MVDFILSDLILAREMALFSAAAYPGQAILQGVKVTPIKSGQFSAIVIESENFITISFTGTDSLSNFITDAKCRQVPLIPDSKIKVHAGFKEGFDALWPFVRDVYFKTNKPVYLTGHSLGAAIARVTFVYAKLVLNQTFPIIVTIGEPRSLNYYGALYANNIKAYSRRYINKYDIVPRIPFINFVPIELFWHCNHDIWIDPEGGIDIDRPWFKKIPNDLRGLRAEFKARNGDILIGDHSSSLYCQTLNNIILPSN